MGRQYGPERLLEGSNLSKCHFGVVRKITFTLDSILATSWVVSRGIVKISKESLRYSLRFRLKNLSFRLGSDLKTVIFARFGSKICQKKRDVRWRSGWVRDYVNRTILLGTVRSVSAMARRAN